MNLWKKLIALRKANSWSQEEFAEKMEISRQAISRWENGTALPDAQNILRISKLFNVTTDYLLNDDYEGETDITLAEGASEETKPLFRKRKLLYWFLIPAICMILLVAYFVVKDNVKLAGESHNQPGQSLEAENESHNQPGQSLEAENKVHDHPELIRVLENEVAPTCTEQGSYDEVIYCAQCGKEVLRTHILKGVPTHQFENQKCVICGKEQRERD